MAAVTVVEHNLFLRLPKSSTLLPQGMRRGPGPAGGQIRPPGNLRDSPAVFLGGGRLLTSEAPRQPAESPRLALFWKKKPGLALLNPNCIRGTLRSPLQLKLPVLSRQVMEPPRFCSQSFCRPQVGLKFVARARSRPPQQRIPLVPDIVVPDARVPERLRPSRRTRSRRLHSAQGLGLRVWGLGLRVEGGGWRI